MFLGQPHYETSLIMRICCEIFETDLIVSSFVDDPPKVPNGHIWYEQAEQVCLISKHWVTDTLFDCEHISFARLNLCILLHQLFH